MNIRGLLDTLAQMVGYTRSAPDQKHQARMHPAGVQPPDQEGGLLAYAASPHVYAGMREILDIIVLAKIAVINLQGQEYQHHPVLDLLGPQGTPNEYQDSVEFFEAHIGDMVLAGNSYWYWSSDGGPPNEVHLLDPRYVRVVPGENKAVAEYQYLISGAMLSLSPERVTHYKLFHPTTRYYGLGAGVAMSDDVMLAALGVRWNTEFFKGGVSVPDGILVVSDRTSPQQRQELEERLRADLTGGRRGTKVIPGQPGSVQYYEGRLRPRDADFGQQREQARQSILETLGVPLGLMSEASTEAHAKVAERRMRARVDALMQRTVRKFNSGPMRFWSSRDRMNVSGIRVADWQQELMRWQTLAIQQEMGQEIDNEVRRE
jgi:HK97 family phage portal protein